MVNRIIVCAFLAAMIGGSTAASAAPGHGGTPSPDQQKQSKGQTEAPPTDAWPKLTADQQAHAVEELKQYAQEVQKRMDHPLKLFETKYFLFYSDLAPHEAQNWAGLLDRMYARLAEMFAVPKGENIWLGKAVVFVFAKADDYRRYESQVMHTDAAGTAGMCHSAGNGIVSIAFYRQPKELEFAHVLVHESVHGFIHRYKSPAFVPSWANEGLAETIATDLVPQPGRREAVKYTAQREIQLHKGVGDLFSADHIEGWQYPVSEMLCTFMIQAGKSNYVAFINGIKSGLTWQDSLETRFKAPQDRLETVFTQWLAGWNNARR